MPLKKEIIYPFFLECCQFTSDAFWEGVFEDLTYGKAPYGTYISKNFLCCSYKNKEFSYKIERKDPKVLHDDVYKLLTEKLGILSHKEKAQKRLVFHEIEKGIAQSRQDWAQIRKKNIKDTMYEKYVIEMKKKYFLNSKDCKYLLSLILVAITFKTISSKDIIYRDDKIQRINGLDFTKGKIIYRRPLCSAGSLADFGGENEGRTSPTEEACKSNSCIKSTKMSENWEKYLKTLRENDFRGACDEGSKMCPDSVEEVCEK